MRGLLAEFDSVPAVLAATEKVRAAGYAHFDVHTPIPIHGLDEAMGLPPSRLPLLVLVGGGAGAAMGLALQWFTNAFDYPLRVSGKPLFGLPAAIPVTFELTVLFGALAAVVGLFAFNRWPQLHSPLFSCERFLRATDDRFYISIGAEDPLFDRERTHALLTGLGALHVDEVEG
jgi:hypothetical protein